MGTEMLKGAAYWMLLVFLRTEELDILESFQTRVFRSAI